MKIDYTKLIVSKLKRSGKKPVRYKELLRDCKRKHFDIDKFNDTVAAMKRRGEITETKYGFRKCLFYLHAQKGGLFLTRFQELEVLLMRQLNLGEEV